jgi:hypothetical protein
MWRYAVDAIDGVERKSDVLSKSIRGIDSRVDSLPMLMFCLHSYMSPLLRQVTVDYNALAALGDEEGEDGGGMGEGYNYSNSDKIQYVKWVEEGKITDSPEQRVVINDLRSTALYICECVYADSIIPTDGGSKANVIDVLTKQFGDDLI